MRGDLRKEPPSDMEFPYFTVTYYDQPESVGITITKTDGRSERWPDSTPEFYVDGSISESKPAKEDTQHQWRQKLGEMLTDKFLLVDERLSAHLQPMKGRRSFLLSFPENYKLFSHTKDGRVDHYLIGSETVPAFRSPQEFFAHARWLMMGAEEDSEGYPACGCKYCDRTRTQKEIDEEFQLHGRKSTRQKGSGYHSGRHGGQSSAASSEAIISKAKDYRNLNKPDTAVQQTAPTVAEPIGPASP